METQTQDKPKAAMLEFDVEDVEYLRHGSESLLATIYKPRGAGPFPTVVDLHGGAWSGQDRHKNKETAKALARSGIVAVCIDFRQGIDGAYPKSVADVNYAVRWVKANAAMLRTRTDMVGLAGQSSGGHLAMLVAMRPHDPRYAAIALPPGSPAVDATVRCVKMTWPVINPLGRYRWARSNINGPIRGEWADTMAKHEGYWGKSNAREAEKNMTEGSPLLILERGEKVLMPPAMWIQVTNDNLHVYHDPESASPGTDMDKFISAYRQAGGHIDVKLFDIPDRFIGEKQPTAPVAIELFELTAGFFHRHIPAVA